jgi:hypothetical protein
MRLPVLSWFWSAVARVAGAAPVPQPEETLPAAAAATQGAPVLAGRRTRAAASAIRRSMSLSVVEGGAAEIFAACATGGVVTGWAVYLGARPATIGFLGALPLAAQMVNLGAAWITDRVGPKRHTVVAMTISRALLFVLVALPVVPLPPAVKLATFVAVIALSTVAGVVGNTAWLAWMSDLVPPAVRGRFFGRRTVSLSLAGTVATLGAGLLLDTMAHRGRPGLGLATLTAAGGTAGLIGVALLLGQHEPRHRPGTTDGRWRGLWLALSEPQVRPYLWYQLAWNGAVGLSASFFAYHLLHNLETGFTILSAHGVTVAFVRILSGSLWGRTVDRLGGQPVMAFCSLAISVVPLVWMVVTPARLWPIALEALASGFLWAGHGIASTELSIGLSPRATRAFRLAAISAAAGVGFALASTVAGQAAGWMPDRFSLLGGVWTSVHPLFLLSAVARAMAATLARRIVDPGARGTAGDVPRVLLGRR